MHQNLALLGFLFLFLAYLAVSEKRDEMQIRWETQVDHSTLSDFMPETEPLMDQTEQPDTLSI